MLAARQLEHVKSDKHVEAREGDDLEDDAGEHDVAAHVGDLGGVGRRGDTAADGLQQEREEVAGDEDIGVQTGPDERELRTDCADHVFEREVKRRC